MKTITKQIEGISTILMNLNEQIISSSQNQSVSGISMASQNQKAKDVE